MGILSRIPESVMKRSLALVYAFSVVVVPALFAQASGGSMEGMHHMSGRPDAIVLTLKEHRNELLLEIGPFDVPAGDDHAAMLDAPPRWVTFPTDGWLRGYTVELIDKNGAKVPQTVLHHINVIATQQRELFSPIMLRIAAASGETNPVILPSLVGLEARQGDTLLVRAMLHGGGAKSYDGVRVRLHFPLKKKDALIGAIRIQPFYMDVTPPQGSHVFDLPPGISEKYWEAQPAIGGRILGFTGHVHKFATRLRLEDRTANKILWEAKPDTNAAGEIQALPLQRFLTYRLSVTYDNPTGVVISDGGMGSLGGVLVPSLGVPWPRIDPKDPLYREDVRGMSTP
jgi:hypothetical protein